MVCLVASANRVSDFFGSTYVEALLPMEKNSFGRRREYTYAAFAVTLARGQEVKVELTGKATFVLNVIVIVE